MAVAVVFGQYHKVLHLRYGKCGAVAAQEQADVAVCRDIHQIQEDMQLNQLTYQVVINSQFVQDVQAVVYMQVITTQDIIVMYLEHQQAAHVFVL